MIDISFTYADLEYFLLILVRVTMFIYIAPFFGMNNTPNRVKIGLGIFISYLLFVCMEHHEVVYDTVTEYAIIVMKEAITGLLIGFGAQMCMTIISFAGRIMDMEVGLSMVSLMDPATKESATFSGVLYQYAFTLMLIISGMYQYLLRALIDSFTLIPINEAVFHTDMLIDSMLRFLCDYVIIGFRICLPVFCVILLLNCILGVLAKVAPQMNMFAVGMQMKILVGLSVLFLTVRMMPGAADFIFQEMKNMITAVMEGLMVA
ncbi:MAG: flagellar biosynthetic protein FliR [Blautia sp.]|nr:flagellar biosynthetic protein FliR [Lachnoclostridium sp.]MCM1210989.1 flagellar biosynthetic protein FliR [Blautia sp.]